MSKPRVTRTGSPSSWSRDLLRARRGARERRERVCLPHGVKDADPELAAALEAAQDPVGRAPGFTAAGYAFDLAENADGSVERVALGTVEAMDPEGDTPVYSLAGGNAAGLFEIDHGTGEGNDSGTTVMSSLFAQATEPGACARRLGRPDDFTV